MRMVRVLAASGALIALAACDPQAAAAPVPSSAPAGITAAPGPSATVTAKATATAKSTATKAPTSAPAAKPTGFVYPAPGQYPQAAGTLPAAAAGGTVLGEQATNLPAPIIRDLGFSGVVAGQSIWTFGDTILDRSYNGLKPMSYDSAGFGSQDNPAKVSFKNLGGFGQPDDWVPLTRHEQDTGGVSRYAMGGTNVVEYAPGKALVYYLKNDRQGGVNRLLGAGVATVTVTATGATSARTRPVHSVNTTDDKDTLLWGKDDPWYGDIGVTFDPRDKKIYAYGNGPDGGVYLARVPAAAAGDVDAYEYWDQSQQRWYTGVKKVDRHQAIFSHHYDTPFPHGEIFSQSNAFWSNYYNTWMFVTSGDYLGKTVAVMTAPKLEGPWTRLAKVSDACPATDGIVCYAVAPHPEYDPTGRTLLITYTEVNQNPGAGTMKIQTRRLTFR